MITPLTELPMPIWWEVSTITALVIVSFRLAKARARLSSDNLEMLEQSKEETQTQGNSDNFRKRTIFAKGKFGKLVSKKPYQRTSDDTNNNTFRISH